MTIKVNEKIKINVAVESSCKIHDFESRTKTPVVEFEPSAVELGSFSKLDSVNVLLFISVDAMLKSNSLLFEKVGRSLMSRTISVSN